MASLQESNKFEQKALRVNVKVFFLFVCLSTTVAWSVPNGVNQAHAVFYKCFNSVPKVGKSFL